MPLIFLPPSKPAGSMRRPFFSAFDALAVDDGRGRTGRAIRLLAASHIKRVVQPVERAVVLPAAKVEVDGAAGRQVLRDRPPLATRAEHIHQTVQDFAQVHGALVPAPHGARVFRPGQRPLVIGQVTGVAKLAAVVAGAVLNTPIGQLLRSGAATWNHNRFPGLNMIVDGHLYQNSPDMTRWGFPDAAHV